jgi:hypothetical protein
MMKRSLNVQKFLPPALEKLKSLACSKLTNWESHDVLSENLTHLNKVITHNPVINPAHACVP